MTKKPNIVRYTGEQIDAMIARGESQTDMARVIAKTEAELERDIASDPDFRDIPEDWYEAAEAIMPAAKRLLSLRLDTDVIDWFRAQGPGYQTRINAVLKAFVTQQAKRKASRAA